MEEKSCIVDGVDLSGYDLDPMFMSLTRDRRIQWCKNKIKESIEEYIDTNQPYKIYVNKHPQERPSWDDYFMQLAQITSVRSCDPASQHGCVIVDSKHRVISMGYNGTVAGVPECYINWERPHKYAWMLHAEENAVAFAKENLEGATSYVTGPSCVKCLRLQLQAGIRTFVFGELVSRCTLNPYEQEVCVILLRETKSEVRYIK